MSKKPPWANAIIGHIEADPRALRANARNWRTHPPLQRAQLLAAMEELGWITEVILNKTTNNLVDGHLRVEEAIKRGETTVPVTVVSLTYSQELLALASFDPISYGAGIDTSVLNSLLQEVSTESPALMNLFDSVLKSAQSLPSPAEVTKDLFPDGDDESAVPLSRPAPQPGERWQLGNHILTVGREEGKMRGGTAKKLIAWWEKSTGSTANLAP